ncbi:MAG TPA: hypothetical protein VM487_21820 [Phycisphaerae bacterium]|nr:hypothetical protein [Phycisphaerae bacterium]
MSANLLLAEVQELGTAGVMLMTICVGLVLFLCAFCFWRILREQKPSEHHHAPLDIDTRDADS